jgi:hypothetical protein
MLRNLGILLGCVISTSALANEMMATAGVNYKSFDYKEELRAPYKSTEKANFLAPFVNLKIPIPNLGETYVQLSAEFSGNVNSQFDGTTQSGVPVKDTNVLSFTDFDGLLFWNVAPELYVQAGLGHHMWNRFLSGGSGYREIYSWYYLPLGILYQHKVNEQLRIGADITYRLMYQGEIKVIFSETVATGDDTTLTLGNRPGYRFQFPVEYSFAGSQLGLLVAPWYEASEIGESDYKYNSTPTSSGTLGYIQEPASKTQQYGFVLGMTARF